MFNLLKYLPLVAMFRDVTDKVRADGEAKRPWFLQRSTVGAIVAAVAAAVTMYYGINIPDAQQAQVTDLVMTVIPAATGIYGMVLSIYGVFKPGKDREGKK